MKRDLSERSKFHDKAFVQQGIHKNLPLKYVNVTKDTGRFLLDVQFNVQPAGSRGDFRRTVIH